MQLPCLFVFCLPCLPAYISCSYWPALASYRYYPSHRNHMIALGMAHGCKGYGKCNWGDRPHVQVQVKVQVQVQC